MLIQKIFHIHQGLQETKARLAHVQSYRQYLEGVKKAVITADGVAQFDCEIPDGFRAHLVVVELPTTDENQILFQSTAGNVDLSGLIEFFPIRDNLTEVQMTIEYTPRSPVRSIFDRFTSSMERFINRQLRKMQSALDRDGLPMPISSSPSRNQSFSMSTAQMAH